MRVEGAIPMRLVLLTLAGALLAGGGLLGMAHRSGPFQWSTGWFWLCLSGLGMVGVVRSGQVLRKGIKAERWSAERVEQARTLTRHPLWTAGMIACFVVMIARGVMTGGVARGPFMLLFLFGNAMSQLSLSLRRETDDPLLPPSMDLVTHASLRSEHWGER